MDNLSGSTYISSLHELEHVPNVRGNINRGELGTISVNTFKGITLGIKTLIFIFS